MVEPLAMPAAAAASVSADPASPPPPGLRASALLLLEHLGDHLDLLKVETSQELSRLGGVLGCWLALALLFQLLLIMGMALLIASYWNTEYRTHCMLLSALLLFGGIAYCLLQLKRFGERTATRFAASGQQLRRDLDLIRELI